MVAIDKNYSLPQKIGRGFFRHIPGWFIFYVGVNSLFSAIVSFNPPHYDWAPTYIFPQALALLYFIGFVRGNDEVKNKKLYIGSIIAAQVLFFLIIYFGLSPAEYAQDIAAWKEQLKSMVFPPQPGEVIQYYAGRDAIVWGHEISSLIWTILIAAHVFYYKRWGGLGFFYGAALLYGMTLESNGVMMKFFFEDQYHLYLPPFHAPVVTMFGWATVFYPCSMVLHQLQKGFPALEKTGWFFGGLMISIFGLMLDIQVDPVATNLTLWTWNSILSDGVHFLGVPLLNFTSWLFAVWVFGSFYLYLTRSESGVLFFSQSRRAIIEHDRRLSEKFGPSVPRIKSWLKQLPASLRHPYTNASESWVSDKGEWTHLRRNLTTIFVIPLMNFISGAGLFLSLLPLEGPSGPSWTILLNYARSIGINIF